MSYARGFENGREIGYDVAARCDAKACKNNVHRGLAYRCGGARNLHEGDGAYGCGGFFCTEHRWGELCTTCMDDQPDDDGST